MKDSTDNSFWGRVKKLIKAHKISQEKFAAYIGVSFGTLKNWLLFDRIPDIVTGCDIADALGVSVYVLARGENRKSRKNRERSIRLRKNAAANIRKMALKIEKDAELIG